jgi:hypothetical protein
MTNLPMQAADLVLILPYYRVECAMASVTIPAVVILVLAAAALHATGNRVIGCSLLVLFPAFVCVAILYDLSLGVTRIGRGAFQSDQKELVFSLVLLVLSLFAALRPKWPWLFWIAWAPCALAGGVLVCLEYFWKVFS